MDREFWTKRWSEKQLGFHEGKPNELLVSHIARLESKRPLRVLVPLAGKAVDLRWLADRGHEVVGIELVPEAVAAFFEEQGLAPTATTLGGLPASRAGDITLVCGDVFELTAEALGSFDVVYDRAALVALEPSTRGRYAALCKAVRGEGGVIFLVAFAYDQTKAPGPPWSIDAATVRELYGKEERDASGIELLSTRSVPTSPRLTEAGIPAFEESAYLIRA